MWAQQIFLAVIGLSAGVAVSGGLFSFIVELGVIADFADRTHTGDHVTFYEDCTALGGIMGNLVYVFGLHVPVQNVGLGVFGIFAGIFVGCWAMALAEVLKVFPVFMRRARIARYLSVFIISLALGKGMAACLFFARGW